MSVTPTKILLIRLRLIGDVVFTTPLIGALKRTFPEAHLAYLVEREAVPIVAHNSHIDELIVVEKSRGWRRIREDTRLAMRLRRARFDLVMDLHGGPRSAWLTLATGAPCRIGYDIQGRRGFYTTMVHRPRGLHPRHSVQNQWDLLTAIPGWPDTTPDRARDAVFMAADADADARVANTFGRRRRAEWGYADRGARQCGQSLSTLARAGIRPVGRLARRAVRGSTTGAQLRSIRSRGQRANLCRGAAGARRRRVSCRGVW